MKKSKSLKSLQLKKEIISSLKLDKIKGGIDIETKPVRDCFSFGGCVTVGC